MPTKKQVPKKILADRGATKASSQTLAARGKLVASVGPQSTVWQNNATIKQSGLDLIAAAAAVDLDDTNISQLQIKIDAAKNLKVQDEATACSKYDVFATNVEDVVTTPKEMQDLGLDPLTEHTYSIATPLGMTAKSDPVLHNIAVSVKRAPGMERCVIEVSSDPTMATNVKTFPGDGARQSMGPFAPGTYALHACHTRASERSAYTEIITVVVK